MRSIARQPRSRSFIPWIFVAFFLVVVAANATMIWIGLTTWPGLVTDHAYERGLHYNRNLEAAEAQAALGWQVDVQAAAIAGGEGTITVTLSDRDGRALDTAEVEAFFRRPTAEGHDFTVHLRPRGEGRYEAVFEPPLPGVWDVHLRIRRGDARWVGEKRLFLR